MPAAQRTSSKLKLYLFFASFFLFSSEGCPNADFADPWTPFYSIRGLVLKTFVLPHRCRAYSEKTPKTIIGVSKIRVLALAQHETSTPNHIRNAYTFLCKKRVPRNTKLYPKGSQNGCLGVPKVTQMLQKDAPGTLQMEPRSAKRSSRSLRTSKEPLRAHCWVILNAARAHFEWS